MPMRNDIYEEQRDRRLGWWIVGILATGAFVLLLTGFVILPSSG